MICVLALIVFSVLGLFSAAYRDLAKEAFDCVFRRVTLRPCNTGFQEKVKSKVLSSIMKRSPKLAKIVNRNLEYISLFFVIAFVASTAYTVYGIYNYIAYGSCNGQNSEQFCVLDPSNKNNAVTAIGATSCGSNTPHSSANLKVTPLDLSDYPHRGSGKKQFVFIGASTCKFTREAFSTIEKVYEENKNDITFTFVHYPIDDVSRVVHQYNFCANKVDSTKYWDFYKGIFDASAQSLADKNTINSILTKAGYEVPQIEACINSQESKDEMIKEIDQITKTGLYGTPLIFIDGNPLVGPKPKRVYNFSLGNFFSW